VTFKLVGHVQLFDPERDCFESQRILLLKRKCTEPDMRDLSPYHLEKLRKHDRQFVHAGNFRVEKF